MLYFLIFFFNLSILNWENTGELERALTVVDLIIGPNGYLYAAANIDTTSLDSGWVFYSSDFYHWQRGNDIPGEVKRIYCFLKTAGETLFIGTKAKYEPSYSYHYNQVDSGRLYFSTDGINWYFRSLLRGRKVGSSITALLEDTLGRIIAGHNYAGMSGYPPCYSIDRGRNWLQGPTTTYNAYHYSLLKARDGSLYCGTWGVGGLVLKSTDHGETWFATDTLFDAGHTPTIIEAPDGILFAGTYPKTNPREPIGRIFKSTNGGNEWIEIGYGYFHSTTGIRSLCLTHDGALYAGTAPNAEVFVSFNNGDSWLSTGRLPGANVVYKLLEVIKNDTFFLYAATGPNGDIFRAVLSTVDINQKEPKLLLNKRGPFIIYNSCGQKIKNLKIFKKGIFFLKFKNQIHKIVIK